MRKEFVSGLRFVGRNLPAPLRDNLVDSKLRLKLEGIPTSYPLPSPVEIEVCGVSAKFNITSPCDFRRIFQWGGFEGDYIKCVIGVMGQLGRKRRGFGKPITFWDIGSAQGLYAVLAANVGCEVVAIDPDPHGMSLLRNNLILNGYGGANRVSRVTTLGLALGGGSNDVDLNISCGDVCAPSLVGGDRRFTKKMLVPMTTIDDLVESGVVLPPNVLKVDVEGYEGEVLKGASTLLGGDLAPSHIFLELHPEQLRQLGSSSEKVVRMLTDCGYGQEFTKERGINTHIHFTRG